MVAHTEDLYLALNNVVHITHNISFDSGQKGLQG